MLPPDSSSDSSNQPDDGDQPDRHEHAGPEATDAMARSASSHRAVIVARTADCDLSLQIREGDSRCVDDQVCLETRLGDRVIAQVPLSRVIADALIEAEVFADPVRLTLMATEADPGIQARLFAIVPSHRLRTAVALCERRAEEQQQSEEPWHQPVPQFHQSFEESMAAEKTSQSSEDDDEGSVGTMLLGHIVRFASDRKHPDELDQEAADMLHTILHGELVEQSTKVVDSFLASL